MLLKIALNGARPKSENVYIPHTLDEIEKEVTLLYGHGCKIFHIHCYDEDGNESLKPEDVGRLITKVKGISSDIQLGISSGDWIEPDIEKRMKYINDWQFVPDFISVNMIEDRAVEIVSLLISKGVLIEAGLNEPKAAEIFVKSNLNEGCCRILIEPDEETVGSSITSIIAIDRILDTNSITTKRLLHGFNATAWDILREAKKRGYDSRIGMEDTVYLENGQKVKSNLEILEEARRIIGAI